MSTKRKMSLKQQAAAILKQAEARGVSSNFFFVTTFKRYQVQMSLLEKLENDINENGITVPREYIKNQKNNILNPAINEYNKTATAANGTVASLIKIVKEISNEDADQGSKLQALINGLDD